MASKTLTTLLKHWNTEIPKAVDGFHVLELPFNVEEFCLEMDAIIKDEEKCSPQQTDGEEK